MSGCLLLKMPQSSFPTLKTASFPSVGRVHRASLLQVARENFSCTQTPHKKLPAPCGSCYPHCLLTSLRSSQADQSGAARLTSTPMLLLLLQWTPTRSSLGESESILSYQESNQGKPGSYQWVSSQYLVVCFLLFSLFLFFERTKPYRI